MEKLKKILLAVLVVAVVLLSGCTKRAGESTHEMTLVDYGNANYRIFKHDKTGIYYFAYDDGVCVMLNPDGTPYTGGNTDEK